IHRKEKAISRPEQIMNINASSLLSSGTIFKKKAKIEALSY
ncbi:unnamed protein product, partial [marine sediment metagenome]